MDLGYNRNHGKWFANVVLRAIRRYALIPDGERVAVGLSGGKDSATLLFVLRYLREYSRLDCDLSAIHVRTASDYDTLPLQEYCHALSVPYLETALALEAPAPATGVCAVCARLKRGAAAHMLMGHGIRTIAYGHHATDAAETLLMNVVQHRRLVSFAPRVAVPGTPLIIIRPMIHLAEETVAAVHRRLGLPVLPMACPYAGTNIRATYKTAFRRLAQELRVPRLAERVMEALEGAHPLRGQRPKSGLTRNAKCDM